MFFWQLLFGHKILNSRTLLLPADWRTTDKHFPNT